MSQPGPNAKTKGWTLELVVFGFYELCLEDELNNAILTLVIFSTARCGASCLYVPLFKTSEDDLNIFTMILCIQHYHAYTLTCSFTTFKPYHVVVILTIEVLVFKDISQLLFQLCPVQNSTFNLRSLYTSIYFINNLLSGSSNSSFILLITWRNFYMIYYQE